MSNPLLRAITKTNFYAFLKYVYVFWHFYTDVSVIFCSPVLFSNISPLGWNYKSCFFLQLFYPSLNTLQPGLNGWQWFVPASAKSAFKPATNQQQTPQLKLKTFEQGPQLQLKAFQQGSMWSSSVWYVNCDISYIYHIVFVDMSQSIYIVEIHPCANNMVNIIDVFITQPEKDGRI